MCVLCSLTRRAYTAQQKLRAWQVQCAIYAGAFLNVYFDNSLVIRTAILRERWQAKNVNAVAAKMSRSCIIFALLKTQNIYMPFHPRVNEKRLAHTLHKPNHRANPLTTHNLAGLCTHSWTKTSKFWWSFLERTRNRRAMYRDLKTWILRNVGCFLTADNV